MITPPPSKIHLFHRSSNLYVWFFQLANHLSLPIESILFSLRIFKAFSKICTPTDLYEQKGIAIVCIHIAHKWFHQEPIEIEQWLYYLPSDYTYRHFKRIEKWILHTLDFQLVPLLQELFPPNFYQKETHSIPQAIRSLQTHISSIIDDPTPHYTIQLYLTSQVDDLLYHHTLSSSNLFFDHFSSQ